LAVDLPAGLRPADLALALAVAFLVVEDFADLPADLPLDAFLPAAAMSRSFQKGDDALIIHGHRHMSTRRRRAARARARRAPRSR
jgi:hypothetical protein